MMPQPPPLSVPPGRSPAATPQHVPAVLGADVAAHWLACIEQAAAVRSADDPDVQATSGSLRLRALGPATFADLCTTLWASAAGHAVRAAVGSAWSTPLVCLSAQCWARRQFPARLRPPGQHPHQWHQDGALACRFDPAVDVESLAPIITVWVPLTACGDDAPSLEWIEPSPPRLLSPQELTDEALAHRHGLAARRQARLDAGDALVFGPALVHRSHVGPDMTRPRTSVELRFLGADAVPSRLSGEPLMAMAVPCEPDLRHLLRRSTRPQASPARKRP
jgi:ectoine hydroxylase-related dioxygenase (phytanoyl-CoA dioxygenase family)